jgi:hypothetical protein
VAVADVDGDGILELLISHGETDDQPLSLYKVPNANKWIRIQPLTRFGAPARGAIVRISAGGRKQIRVVDCGSGYLCQMEPVAHFGLGNTSTVESIEITWPDGVRMVMNDIKAETLLTIPYPGG